MEVKEADIMQIIVKIKAGHRVLLPMDMCPPIIDKTKWVSMSR